MHSYMEFTTDGIYWYPIGADGSNPTPHLFESLDAAEERARVLTKTGIIKAARFIATKAVGPCECSMCKFERAHAVEENQ